MTQLRQRMQEDVGPVYSKPPFGGPEHVLNYVARYTRRGFPVRHDSLRLASCPVDRLSIACLSAFVGPSPTTSAADPKKALAEMRELIGDVSLCWHQSR